MMASISAVIQGSSWIKGLGEVPAADEAIGQVEDKGENEKQTSRWFNILQTQVSLAWERFSRLIAPLINGVLSVLQAIGNFIARHTPDFVKNKLDRFKQIALSGVSIIRKAVYEYIIHPVFHTEIHAVTGFGVTVSTQVSGPRAIRSSSDKTLGFSIAERDNLEEKNRELNRKIQESEAKSLSDFIKMAEMEKQIKDLQGQLIGQSMPVEKSLTKKIAHIISFRDGAKGVSGTHKRSSGEQDNASDISVDTSAKASGSLAGKGNKKH